MLPKNTICVCLIGFYRMLVKQFVLRFFSVKTDIRSAIRYCRYLYMNCGKIEIVADAIRKAINLWYM